MKHIDIDNENLVSSNEVKSLLIRIRMLEDKIYMQECAIKKAENYIKILNKIVGVDDYNKAEMDEFI